MELRITTMSICVSCIRVRENIRITGSDAIVPLGAVLLCRRRLQGQRGSYERVVAKLVCARIAIGCPRLSTETLFVLLHGLSS